MRLQHGVDGNRPAGPDRLHAPDHGVDVAEHLRGRHVARGFTALAGRFGAEQAPSAHLQALDPGRADGLGAEQQAGEGLGAGEGRRGCVELDERRLGIADVGGDVAVEGEPSAGQPVGPVDRVGARPAVAPGQPGGVALPAPFFQTSHGRFLIQG